MLRTTINRFFKARGLAGGGVLASISLLLALTSLLLEAVPAQAASNFIPAVVTTANTTLYASPTAISPGRVGVDKAGNVFYMVNGGTSSTLMEIPAASPAVTNTAPLTLITGLGQYNANVAFVDVKGNLWVSVGNGTAVPPGGSTDYLSLVEIPAVNGLPNVAAIPAGGESLNTLDATHCAAGSTAPCTYQNYKLNSPGSSPINGPQVADLFVDGAGNVYFVDSYDNTSTGKYNVLAKVNLAAGGTATVVATNLPSSGRSQVAVDGGGNVFYYDATMNVVSQVSSSGVLTTVGMTATTPTAQITSPSGISADAYGNLYIANAGQLSEVPFEGTAVNFADEFGIVSGLGTATTNNISYGGSVDANGNYYYAANGGSSTTIQQLQVNGYSFGNVKVGTLVTGPSLTVYFNTAEPAIGNYFVTGSPTTSTAAQYLQSFPYSGTKSIAGGANFTAGMTGTITMNFQPVHPGLLKGSYTPRSNGVNDTVVNLQGTGVGPLPAFFPGVASTLFSSAATSTTVATQVPLSGPLGLAVDTFGDVFVADPGNGKVDVDCLATTTAAVDGNGTTANGFCASTGYTGVTVELGTGFTKPSAIAIDGANNLYVTDSTANTVTEIQGVNAASSVLVSATATFGGTALSAPRGIVADGYANLFIVDSGNNRVVEAHQFGAVATNNVVVIPSTTTFGGTALNNPVGIAIDAAGDLFIADKGNNRIVEYTPFGVASVVTTTGITLNAPTGVKVLPSGTLVVTDSANNVSLISGGTASALPVGATTPVAPQGVAVDLAGNIYLSDTAGNHVVELAISTPAPVAFASTAQGGTSAANALTVLNVGNAALVLSAAPAITSGAGNFNVLSSGTCANGTSLAAGTGNCTVSTNFTPQSSGPLTGTATLTDNQLNYTLNTTTANETGTFAANGTQAEALAGTGTGAASQNAATPTFTPAAGTYTSVQTVTIADTTSGATIYYTVDGTTPTSASTQYTGAITVSTSETIKAVATASGFGTSAVASAAYTINLPPKAPGVVLSQTQLYGAITSGGAALDGGNPAGNTMAVNAAGAVIISTTYGGKIDMITATGTTVLGSYGNPGPVAIDSNNNLYIGNTYGNQITKIPYVGGAYPTITATTGSTPTCTGADVVECNLPSVSSSLGGIGELYFDASGNLFITGQVNNTPETIYECTAACLKAGTATATLLYTEPSGSGLAIGGLAADPFGDFFFTDSVISGNLNSSKSNLKELAAATGGTGFSATATTLYAYTTATPSDYDNQLDAVATDAAGTVYFATQNDGLFALLNNKGVIATTIPYTVSTQGAKILTTDGKGNFYAAGYNGTLGGDAVTRISVGVLTAPTVAVGSSSTSMNVTSFVNDAACSTSPKVTFAATANGAATTEFTAATTAACSSTLTNAAAFPTTVTFKPATTGPRTAMLTGTDSAGGTGTASVTGIGSSLPNAAAPTFTPGAGTYTSIQSVTLASSTAGAMIYYTTNGTTPTTSSSLYTGPIAVGVSETITAIATATGFNPSASSSAAYVINLPNAPAPTFSPAAGTYTSVQTVTIADSVAGATIYYTTDGTAPTTSSMVYSAPITIGVTETINAIAAANGYNNSPAGTAAYVINLPAATPTFNPNPGTYTSIQSVTLMDTTTGAMIYYTLDGSTPTTASTLYTAPLTIAATTTIKAIAIAAGYSSSAVATGLFTINLPPAATPVVLPPSGTYTTVQTVTITDSIQGARIYYTLDGSTPTTASTPYTGSFTAAVSETVKAIAVATGYSTSAVGSSTFTINLPTPGFTMVLTPAALSVANGSTSATNVVLSSVGTFNSAVTFACGGLPAGVTCTFAPNSVTPTVSGAATQLTVSVPPNFNTRLEPLGPLGPMPRNVVPGVTLALLCGWFGLRKRRRLSGLLMLLITLCGMSMLAGCGSAPNYLIQNVTVTGTSGSVTQSATLTLTLQ